MKNDRSRRAGEVGEGGEHLWWPRRTASTPLARSAHIHAGCNPIAGLGWCSAVVRGTRTTRASQRYTGPAHSKYSGDSTRTCELQPEQDLRTSFSLSRRVARTQLPIDDTILLVSCVPRPTAATAATTTTSRCLVVKQHCVCVCPRRRQY